jgi:hypothetical protein
LSRKGKKMAMTALEWFRTLPQTSLQIDHIPVFAVDPLDLKQPYEFFLEENQNRPFRELYVEYNQRQLQAMQKQLEDFQHSNPLDLDDVRAALAAHSAAREAQKLTLQEKVALGLGYKQNQLTLGDLKEVRISGNKKSFVLTTVDRNNVPRGRVEIPLDHIRIGFKNSVASWQAARYIENPQGFLLSGQGDRAIRRFFMDLGRVLLEWPTNGMHLGYLFDYNQTASKPGQRPEYVHISLVTLRDCDRSSIGPHEILFPRAGSQSGQPRVCASLTEFTLQTPY